MSKSTAIRNTPLAAIDLFCGAGGLTHGLIKAGIPVLAGFDIDKTCKFAYEHNNGNAKFISKDIKEITSDEIINFFPENVERIMVGCAPCQTFSTHTHKNSGRQKDKKWNLINEYLKKIIDVKPTVLSMENVPGLRNYKIFDDFVSALKKEGYFVSHKLVYCPDFGIPQSRRRLVLLASKYGPIDLIAATHTKDKYETVETVIGNLPKLEAGAVDPNDPLHKCASLSELNMERMVKSKPGGTWLDWPEELRLECHKKKSGSSYKSVYARMKWNALAPTMTTQFHNFGTGRFGHPTQNRALSIREGALIQTFPKDYQFFPKDSAIDIGPTSRMIGNAVPVRLGEVIGRSIKEHLKKHNVII